MVARLLLQMDSSIVQDQVLSSMESNRVLTSSVLLAVVLPQLWNNKEGLRGADEQS